ncbi:MAG: beta-galactosidase [Anaerolineae bacterium]|nr:beta-galactosidase [Anaerolineae bacterium]
MAELPFRQVHLDFHTSPLIPDVASEFDPVRFADGLAAAAVNSVTVFAKCHHGMSYYPTEVGVVHPALERDLLGDMIRACHRRGIRTPVYISVVWDEHAAHIHPEWQQVSPSGVAGINPPFQAGWKYLCMNSPYLDYVAAQTEEVVRRYPVDGIFFDIIFQAPPGCVCKYCLDGMVDRGLNPQDEDDLRLYSADVARRAMRSLSAVVREHRPEAGIFFNGRVRLARDADSGLRAELPYMTHIEVESLPSGEWGYLHYPMYARYVQSLGTEFLGMTARFHKSWADFGGLKNRAALEYEVFSMLATGARCSIGDQLHPRGRLEAAAYERIGDVYRSVEAKEPWCRGARPIPEVAVLVAAEGWDRRADVAAEEGATRMLLESQWQFQLVDQEADLEQFACVVLPDRVPVGAGLGTKLRRYVDGGGSLLASGRSSLTSEGFALGDVLGIEYAGEAEYTTHYLDLERDLGLPEMQHVMYEAPVLVRAEEGTRILGRIVRPYFERSWDHFCSHRQTPPAAVTEWPAIVQRGRAIYLASPIFSAYRRHGSRAYRQLVEGCLKAVAPAKLVQAEVPTGAQVTLLRQEGRLVCHLLYYVPERRTPDIDIIEDVVPLSNVRLSVRLGGPPRRVYLAPEGRDLCWEYGEERASVVVPEVRGHQMVVFEA